MKNIFLSDLHMGVNYKTNIYQQNFHEPYLKTILKYVQDNASDINDVVILGDWLDFWMYPAEYKQPTATDILNAHPGVFQPSDDGDFVSCMDAIQGNLIYVSGNHDMTLDIKILQDHFSSLSQKGKTLVHKGDVYVNASIHAEHGHACTYFNAPDHHSANTFAPLPIGFYMTRLGAVSCEEKLDTIADCSLVSGNDYPTVGQMVKKELLPYAEVLANPIGVLSIVAFVGFRPNKLILGLESKYANMKDAPISMPGGKSISVKQASDMLSYLRIDSVADIEAVVADSMADLHRYAKSLLNQDIKIVIMGHTHRPCLNLYPGPNQLNGIYANSGFIAPDQVSFQKQTSKITFVEADNHGTVVVKEVKFDHSISDLYSDSTIGQNTPFDYTAAGDSGVLSGGLLEVGAGSLLVNYQGEVKKISELPPGSIIPKVADIELKFSKDSLFDYEVLVTVSDGGIHFEFTDQSPDTYSLSIFSTLLKKSHKVGYHSSDPLVNKISYKLS